MTNNRDDAIPVSDAASARLQVRAGFCTERGERERNEDYAGVMIEGPRRRARFGVVAAIADGVGGAKGGRVAAELAVRGFIDGELGRDDMLGVRDGAVRIVEALNRWIHAIGAVDAALEGMCCTFTALVMRGRQAHVVHVGDTRLYRLRDDRLRTRHTPTGLR